MEHRGALSVDEVLRRIALPVEVKVVTGFESQLNEAFSLSPGERIGVHCIRNEVVFIGVTEASQQTFTLPLQSANRLEILPDLPELDDRVFPTVRDVLEAAPKPTWVRAQESYDGGYDYNTVHEGEEFQNFYAGKTYRGEPCMRCNIVHHEETEDAALVLNTRAMFTTTRSPSKFLTAADFARTYDLEDELAVRVRIHWVRTRDKEMPQLPVKAKLLRLTEQRIAVCTARTGRIFLLPSSTSSVSLQVSRRLIPLHVEDLAIPLYSKLDVMCLPRIEPPPMSAIFVPYVDNSKPAAKPRPSSFKQLAVLFSPSLYGLATSHIHNTATYSSLTVSDPVREVSRVTTSRLATPVLRGLKKVRSHGDESYLKCHCDLTRVYGVVSRLLAASYPVRVSLGDSETPEYEELDSDFGDDVWFKDVSYDEEFNNPEKKSAIYDVLPRSTSRHSLYDIPKSSRPVKTILDHFDETEELEENITKFRRESAVLKELIVGRQLKLESVQKEIRRWRAIEEQKHRNPNEEAELLQSLSTAHVTNLLCNLGFSEYVPAFLREGMEGYLLSGCDIDVLKSTDLGMRPAHARKLLAVLNGRIPLGSTLTDLIQQAP